MLKFYSFNEPTGSDEQQVLDAICRIFRGLYMLQYCRLNCMPLKHLEKRMQAKSTKQEHLYTITQWSYNLSTVQFLIAWNVIVPCGQWLNVTS